MKGIISDWGKILRGAPMFANHSAKSREWVSVPVRHHPSEHVPDPRVTGDHAIAATDALEIVASQELQHDRDLPAGRPTLRAFKVAPPPALRLIRRSFVSPYF
jgi:hypothetical protein